MAERDSPRAGHEILYFTHYTIDRITLLVVNTTSEIVPSLRIPLFVGAEWQTSSVNDSSLEVPQNDILGGGRDARSQARTYLQE
jgi:hypothetical protein